jgi:hypothetical protein
VHSASISFSKAFRLYIASISTSFHSAPAKSHTSQFNCSQPRLRIHSPLPLPLPRSSGPAATKEPRLLPRPHSIPPNVYLAFFHITSLRRLDGAPLAVIVSASPETLSRGNARRILHPAPHQSLQELHPSSSPCIIIPGHAGSAKLKHGNSVHSLSITRTYPTQPETSAVVGVQTAYV